MIDRITGKSQRIKQRNEEEVYKSIQRKQKERDVLIFEHLKQRQILQARIVRLNTLSQKRHQALTDDIKHYCDICKKQSDVFERQTKSWDRER